MESVARLRGFLCVFEQARTVVGCGAKRACGDKQQNSSDTTAQLAMTLICYETWKREMD